jgi:hypothetical protein
MGWVSLAKGDGGDGAGDGFAGFVEGGDLVGEGDS